MIELPTADKGEIRISDATGRISYRQGFDKVDLITVETALSTGIYFVQVIGEKGYQSIKWNNCKE